MSLTPSRRSASRKSRTVSRRVLAGVAASTLLVGLIAATSAEAVEDLSTTIAVGTDPSYVAFSPDGTRAYVTNRFGDSVTVIDAITAQPLTTVTVGTEPHGVAVSPDGSQVYVTNITSATVSVISTATNTVIDTITVGAWAYDVAFTPDGTKAYVTNYFDTTSFPGTTGSVAVIDVATGNVTATLQAAGGPEGVAVSPDGTIAYVTFVNGGVYVIDVATDTVVDTIPNPGFPTAVVFSNDGAYAYTSNNSVNEVAIIDVAAGAVIDTLPVDGNYPNDIDITADGETVYVSFGEGTVEGIQPIDVATGTIGARVPIGDGTTGVAGLAAAPTGDFLYVVNSYEQTIQVVGDPVRRLTGTNRYGTAIKISQTGFPAGANVVFVATGTDYPDALAAGPAAAKLGGPVILTDNAAMAAEVKAEIERLNPAQIYVVGGPDRVSNAILTQLNTIAPAERISGSNRFETSRLIADLAFDAPITDVYVATGRNFPDALAAGAAGAVFGAPVILVEGLAPTVDQGTLDLLTLLGSPAVTVVGGTNMVSDGIKDQLGATRITGTNRYETALMINEDAYTGHTATRAIIATGVIFPDALSASAWSGKIDAPLYLSPGTCVPQGVLDHMTSLGVLQVTLVGGPDRLTQSVFDLVPC